MSIHPASSEFLLEPSDTPRLANLCGPLDEHLRQVEGRLGVEINSRGNAFQVIGDAVAVRAAGRVLKSLYLQTDQDVLTPERVHLALQESSLEHLAADGSDIRSAGDEVMIRTRRGIVKGQGVNQKDYLRAILAHDLAFGIGPAGTGKTYLAVACAVEALERERVRRVVLVRPAVEAGGAHRDRVADHLKGVAATIDLHPQASLDLTQMLVQGAAKIGQTRGIGRFQQKLAGCGMNAHIVISHRFFVTKLNKHVGRNSAAPVAPHVGRSCTSGLGHRFGHYRTTRPSATRRSRDRRVALGLVLAQTMTKALSHY
jgi:hypothetical protein